MKVKKLWREEEEKLRQWKLEVDNTASTKTWEDFSAGIIKSFHSWFPLSMNVVRLVFLSNTNLWLCVFVLCCCSLCLILPNTESESGWKWFQVTESTSVSPSWSDQSSDHSVARCFLRATPRPQSANALTQLKRFDSCWCSSLPRTVSHLFIHTEDRWRRADSDPGKVEFPALLKDLNKWKHVTVLLFLPLRSLGSFPRCRWGRAYVTEGFTLTQMEKTKPAAALPLCHGLQSLANLEADEWFNTTPEATSWRCSVSGKQNNL